MSIRDEFTALKAEPANLSAVFRKLILACGEYFNGCKKVKKDACEHWVRLDADLWEFKCTFLKGRPYQIRFSWKRYLDYSKCYVAFAHYEVLARTAMLPTLTKIMSDREYAGVDKSNMPFYHAQPWKQGPHNYVAEPVRSDIGWLAHYTINPLPEFLSAVENIRGPSANAHVLWYADATWKERQQCMLNWLDHVMMPSPSPPRVTPGVTHKTNGRWVKLRETIKKMFTFTNGFVDLSGHSGL